MVCFDDFEQFCYVVCLIIRAKSVGASSIRGLTAQVTPPSDLTHQNRAQKGHDLKTLRDLITRKEYKKFERHVIGSSVNFRKLYTSISM